MTFPIQQFQNIRTPFYYYDTELLRQTLAAIKEATANHDNYCVHYAVKANANPQVLYTISQSGLGADCVSGGEIRAAINAGFPADKIVYAGVGKSDWEIELGLEKGIFCFNVESEAELEVIEEIAARMQKTARVAFRINPNVGAHTHANITTGLAENKFGIALEHYLEVMQAAAKMQHIDVVGLHFHIGSQILEMDDFKALCLRINEIQTELDKACLQVENINVGGGLGISYTAPDKYPIPNFKDYFQTFADNLQLRKGQKLHFELGRAVVAQCGSLITRLLYVKQGSFKQFAIVDAGMTDLIRPALYQAHHEIENITSESQQVALYDVVGPICESSDVFDKAVELKICHRGDLLALRSAGAYGEIMASGYNCRTLPKGYVTEDLC